MIYVLKQKYENNVYPDKPQFYYIKVGVRGYTLHGRVVMMFISVCLVCLYKRTAHTSFISTSEERL